MDRRGFLESASTGAVVATAASATARDEDRKPLPKSQFAPLPDLGSHWETFSKLSARCVPDFSFLDERFTDPQEWGRQARAKLRAGFHYDPDQCAPAPEVVDRVDRGAYVRERVMINTTPDIRIPVYVLVPKGLRGPAPAIVALHDHGGFYFWGKEKVVEVAPENAELVAFKRKYYAGRSVADELAKRGYVVIAPDMLHWGERGMYLDADPDRIKRRTAGVTREDVREFNARSSAHEQIIGRTALACGVTWSGIIAMDDFRVTDYLLSRPEVDKQRVGCVGLSLGAVRSVYLGALHPAVRASVPVCWMAEYQPIVRNIRYVIGFTKLVPGLYDDLDWPDLAGLHWPGALLTINGLKDRLYPLTAARGAVGKIERIFAKMGAPENYRGVFFDGPHEFNREMQSVAFDWFDKQLRDG